VDQTLIVQLLTSLGEGAYIPVVLTVIGAASALSTVYPSTWKGAAIVHKVALLFGRAAPAVPASAPATSATTGVK
jgi:hypothetical protein